jgi:hypothetical protein
MAKLWKMFGREPYLVNPHLLSINPKRGRKMAKKKTHHRQPPALRAYWAAHRAKHNPPRKHHHKKNPYFANSPKRHHRKHYRHNPPMFAGGAVMGINLKDAAFAGGGFLAPPFIEGFALPYLPTMLQTGIGRYALKIGIVLGLAYAGGKFISGEAGKMIGIGGGVYILANAVVDLAPTLFPGFSGPRGFMNPGSTTRMLPRGPATMRAQPFLGGYKGYVSGYGSMNNPATETTVERMNPEARF